MSFGAPNKDPQLQLNGHFISFEGAGTGRVLVRQIGVNYIHGSSIVLCTLAYFHKKHEQDSILKESITRAISFLESWQNPDCGWDESINSYKSNAPCRSRQRSTFGVFAACASTPSQTARGLMVLLAFRPAQHDVIESGIRYLVTTQIQEDSKGTPTYGHGRK